MAPFTCLPPSLNTRPLFLGRFGIAAEGQQQQGRYGTAAEGQQQGRYGILAEGQQQQGRYGLTAEAQQQQGRYGIDAEGPQQGRYGIDAEGQQQLQDAARQRERMANLPPSRAAVLELNREADMRTRMYYEDLPAEDQHRYATTIQRHFRGHQARRQMQQQYPDVFRAPQYPPRGAGGRNVRFDQGTPDPRPSYRVGGALHGYGPVNK